MFDAQSVSRWIADLKEGKGNAAQCLWERYAAQLVNLARSRLKVMPRRAADEEDIAASVFQCLCRGAAAGRFQDVKNRDELWWLLLAITKQKVIDHIRRETAQKRGGPRSDSESTFRRTTTDYSGSELDDIISDEPTPEFVIMLQEQHTRLLDLLRDDSLRYVAVSRIEGFTVPEIAEKMRLSTRSVERKLHLIRGMWSEELTNENAG